MSLSSVIESSDLGKCVVISIANSTRLPPFTELIFDLLSTDSNIIPTYLNKSDTSTLIQMYTIQVFPSLLLVNQFASRVITYRNFTAANITNFISLFCNNLRNEMLVKFTEELIFGKELTSIPKCFDNVTEVKQQIEFARSNFIKDDETLKNIMKSLEAHGNSLSAGGTLRRIKQRIVILQGIMSINEGKRKSIYSETNENL